MESFLEAVSKQTEAMLRQARRLEARGYMVLVHRLNADATHNEYLHGFLNGGFERFASDFHHNQRTGGRVVIVHIWPESDPATRNSRRDFIEARKAPFERPFTFTCRIPTLKRYKPIIAALELMSARRKGRKGELKGAGMFECTDASDYCEYRGQGKAALAIFLRVLEMPHHQEILKGEKSCPILSLAAA